MLNSIDSLRGNLASLITNVSIVLLLLFLFPIFSAWGAPTTAIQARRVVEAWLKLDSHPLGAPMGQVVRKVQTFEDNQGNAMYYVVSLEPAGMVILPADDLVEPIVAFSPNGKYKPAPANPLTALVGRDLPGRVAAVRALQAKPRAPGEKLVLPPRWSAAQKKWRMLEQVSAAITNGELAPHLTTPPSDLRVGPLLATQWDQMEFWLPTCSSWFPCGCVATAMGQLMKYHEYPAGISSIQGTISLLVRDPYSGLYYLQPEQELFEEPFVASPYDWSHMPNTMPAMVPDANGLVTDTGYLNIYKLLHDAATSVDMKYNWDTQVQPIQPYGEADLLKAAVSLTSVFGYGNAKKGYYAGNNIPYNNLMRMINPNLDAQLPVLLGIYDPTPAPGGHAVVADGYGQQLSTWYHHLNMGWAGDDNWWYNLPNIDTTKNGTFSIVDKCIYNIYKSGGGEIISGRVLDANGQPLKGATVTITSPGISLNCVTNDKGIYFFTKLPSNHWFSIKAVYPGKKYRYITVSTGTSEDNTIVTGNLWGIDFYPIEIVPIITHLLLSN